MITRRSKGGTEKQQQQHQTGQKAVQQSLESPSKSKIDIPAPAASEERTKRGRKNSVSSRDSKSVTNQRSASKAIEKEKRTTSNNTSAAAVSTSVSDRSNHGSNNNTIKCRLVGGPLVGRQPRDELSANHSLPSSWRYYKPIITPEIITATATTATSFNSKPSSTNNVVKQRFILLPHPHHITVLAYKTGAKLATIVPTMVADDDDDDEQNNGGDVIIESVCLARGRRPLRRHSVKDIFDKMDVDGAHDDDEAIKDDEDNHAQSHTHEGTVDDDDVLALVGCQDGTIREISLTELVKKTSVAGGKNNQQQSSVRCGGYEIPGPFIRPRRVIRVSTQTGTAVEADGSTKEPSCQSVIHLAVPELHHSITNSRDGLWVYCIMQSPDIPHEEPEDDGNGKKKVKQQQQQPRYAHVETCRLIIPSFDGSTVVDLRPEVVEGDDDGDAVDDGPITESYVHELSPLSIMKRMKCRIDSSPHVGSRITRTVPFQLLAVTRAAQDDEDSSSRRRSGISVFVVVARANSLMIYHDLLITSSSSSAATRCRSFPPVDYRFDDNSQLTTVDVSLNKSDVTCGHRRGKIGVMNDLLVQVELHNIRLDQERALQMEIDGNDVDAYADDNAAKALAMSAPPKIVVSKAHWHAHPVASLSYDVTSSAVDPLLYSGGDESVMVTWQTAQGRDRPSDVLPRLALGGIVHLVMCSRDRSIDSHPASGILVFCEDNSLQLIESHNKGRIWKTNGLAVMKPTSSKPSKSKQMQKLCQLRIEPDPRSNKQRRSPLIMTGLADAPGLMHWYDPIRERIALKLEVAPFNRVSRTDPDEKPLPAPCVIHHAFSGNGSDLITVDEAPTENSLVGAYEQHNGTEYGIVSTIRFWSLNDGPTNTRASQRNARAPYLQIASMTYPHGPKNRVDALALSNDGVLACTVSNQEKAFRIWEKDVLPVVAGSTRDDDEAEDGPAETWTCRYKVSVPSGLSNFATPTGGVAFSDDGSILAVAFGRHVTLWDADEAQLLTSFQDGGGTDIEHVHFANAGLHRDLLLVKCQNGVSLRSPYSETGSTASFESWTWSLARTAKSSTVSAVTLIDSHNSVAISIYDAVSDHSKVILVDASTGTTRLSNGANSSVIYYTKGRIECLTAVGTPNNQSNWDSKPRHHPPLLLYAMLSSAELVLLHDLKDASQSSSTQTAEMNLPLSTGPSLNIRIQQPLGSKRRLDAVHMPRSERSTKRSALDIFGITAIEGMKNAGPTTNNLPSLSSNFVRSLVGRNLSAKT